MIDFPIYDITRSAERQKYKSDHVIFEGDSYDAYFVFQIEEFKNRLLKMVCADCSGEIYLISEVHLERIYQYWSFFGKLKVNLIFTKIDRQMDLDEFKEVVKERVLQKNHNSLLADLEEAKNIREVIGLVHLT